MPPRRSVILPCAVSHAGGVVVGIAGTPGTGAAGATGRDAIGGGATEAGAVLAFPFNSIPQSAQTVA